MTTFYLVRHGETDWNKERRLQGKTDNDLNESGVKQAEALASILRDVPFDLAFSSDLVRAKRTAEIITLEKKLHVATTKFIRERDFLHLEGKTSDVFVNYLKLMSGLSHEERSKHRIAEGIESDEEVISRLFTFLRETAITHPNKTILVGSHSGLLRLLLIHTGYISYQQMDHKRFQNGAYIIFESDGIDFFIKKVVGIEDR
ncbi:MAG TPA: histidine phosphatase family protein [Patescibacteria group bacterium]|nr:histidine phosphatase family protein [Patescibacteria group bacterium]